MLPDFDVSPSQLQSFSIDPKHCVFCMRFIFVEVSLKFFRSQSKVELVANQYFFESGFEFGCPPGLGHVQTLKVFSFRFRLTACSAHCTLLAATPTTALFLNLVDSRLLWLNHWNYTLCDYSTTTPLPCCVLLLLYLFEKNITTLITLTQISLTYVCTRSLFNFCYLLLQAVISQF